MCLESYAAYSRMLFYGTNILRHHSTPKWRCLEITSVEN